MKDEIKGKADELKGKLTGDKSEEMKGKAEQAGDKVRRDARDLRDDLTEGGETPAGDRTTSAATRAGREPTLSGKAQDQRLDHGPGADSFFTGRYAHERLRSGE